MATTGEPLSDARLAEIRESLHDRSEYSESFGIIDTADMGLELVAEVERLRAERAALLAVVERVVKINPLAATPGAPGGGVFNCPFCGEQPFKRFDNDPWMDAGWEHAPDCLVTKARALLASNSPK